ncbi:penicillin-binding transpeptidase domain-containing protein [Paenibacillus sp. NPDC058071]|uniref:penicillin-binding transpeptidase domain-containing protein n=1 Tax=Paenibacillus sp. NPDC058071 TaxID=3346326 RepID=UPI0036D85E2A
MHKRIRLRTLLFGGFLTLLFLVLISRVFYVQVVKGDYWFDLAKTRWSAQEKLVAHRGNITDRNGNVLAMDTLAYTVAVSPYAINKLELSEEVVKGLHDILGKPEDELRKQINAQNEKGEFYKQREIRREGLKIDKEKADKVKEFRQSLIEKHKLKSNVDVGIYLMYDQKRYYPRDSLASQLIGYVDMEGEAKTGVESSFDKLLRGVDGELKYEKDGKRIQLARGEFEYVAQQDGKDIKLTIDSEIQGYVEQALKEIVKQYNPKTVTAIAADPKTMEILAMAHMPTYNPNTYWKADFDNAYNHSIRSLYEPGSTFKIVTLAAAVEEGLFNPGDTYQSGSIRVDSKSKPIRDSNRVGWGRISYLDGLKHSSNVAFVKLGYEQLGGQKLLSYINSFGFGQKTGIQLSGEAAGKINLNLSIPRDIASVTFGQGPVQVTPIQQLTAVAAVANGGKLLQPQIVKEIYDPTTKTTQTFEPKFVRQVISEETSKKVGEYLEQVVSDRVNGTGRNAYIEGYRVAGKTGTAQKTVKGVTGYSLSKFVVSFIGYAPVENPRIVLYIVVDEPNNSLASGGGVAAPAFKEIVSKTLRHMGVAPSYEVKDKDKDKDGMEETKKETVKVPDVRELTLSNAKAQLKSRSLTFEVVGEGSSIVQQVPAAGTLVHPTQRIYLITEQREKVKVPDLTGVSLRDAVEISSVLNVKLVIEGEGYVVSQKEEQRNGERVLTLKLEPPLGSDTPRTEDGGSDEDVEGAAGEGSDSDSANDAPEGGDPPAGE